MYMHAIIYTFSYCCKILMVTYLWKRHLKPKQTRNKRQSTFPWSPADMSSGYEPDWRVGCITRARWTKRNAGNKTRGSVTPAISSCSSASWKRMDEIWAEQAMLFIWIYRDVLTKDLTSQRPPLLLCRLNSSLAISDWLHHNSVQPNASLH